MPFSPAMDTNVAKNGIFFTTECAADTEGLLTRDPAPSPRPITFFFRASGNRVGTLGTHCLPQLEECQIVLWSAAVERAHSVVNMPFFIPGCGWGRCDGAQDSQHCPTVEHRTDWCNGDCARCRPACPEPSYQACGVS